MTRVCSWFRDIDVNGRPYPTRHSVPDLGPRSSAYMEGLSGEVRAYLRAFHESAHAVAGLVGGGCVQYAEVSAPSVLAMVAASREGVAGGTVDVRGLPDGRAFAVFLGAGERAEDRWLRRQALWTPARAVGVELSASGDRNTFLSVNPHIRFGVDRNDYRIVHDLADEFIDRHWTAITAVADVLATRLHLSGAQISALAHLPNGTHICKTATTP